MTLVIVDDLGMQWQAAIATQTSKFPSATERLTGSSTDRGKHWWNSHPDSKPNTSVSLSHWTKADSDADRSNQSLSVCPNSFNTQSRLIKPTLDGNNLTLSLSHSSSQSKKSLFVKYKSAPAVLAMWYLKVLTPVHVRLVMTRAARIKT